MNARVSEIAAQDGLDYHLDDAKRANTVDAHRLLHLAHAEGGPGAQDALKERLLAAYFVEGRAVGDHEVLAALATEVGLPAERVRGGARRRRSSPRTSTPTPPRRPRWARTGCRSS